MTIEFYFDPSCPWCWVTSRWLVEVQSRRKLTVDWKPFSLQFKNASNEDAHHLQMHTVSHRMLRIIEAARVKFSDAVVGDLYTRFGTLTHVLHDTSDEAIAKVLNRLAGMKDLIGAADDASYDKIIQKSMQSAYEVVGEDVGTPIIIINTPLARQGYFGPVITQLPTGEEALTLWDSFVTLASYPHFYELKRTRHDDPVIPESSQSAQDIC